MPKTNPALAQAWGDTQNSRLKTEIEDLKQQLEELQSNTDTGIETYPIGRFIQLQLPDGLTQPRKYFDLAGMEKLKQSIRKHGVQEPLIVRPGANGKLEIISGERRWRCSIEESLTEIPAICREYTDEEALEIALIANLIRENLNIIEETDSITALIGLRLSIPRESIPSLLVKILNLRSRHEMDDEDIVKRIQSDKSDFSRKIIPNSLADIDGILDEFQLTLAGFVTNRLNALQKMPEKLIEAVRAGQIDFSKADLIRKAPEEKQDELLTQASNEDWSKTQLAEKVKALKTAPNASEEDLRDRIHQGYSSIRSKRNWKRIEADSKLKKKAQKLESLIAEILSELDEQREE